jgi:hypothetical protein
MKIKFHIKEDNLFDNWRVTFNIEEISDEEIISIVQYDPIAIDLNPGAIGVIGSFIEGKMDVNLQGKDDYLFILKEKGNGEINFVDLYQIRLGFKNIDDAMKYKEFIERQFEKEIHQINGIKKIYEGAEKVLDKNSKEYKEIIEKNKEAWKKLADL